MNRRFPVLAGAAAMACCAVLQSLRAAADEPTTADCLAASEKSLTSKSEHRLRMERTQLLTCAAPSCPADVRRECVRRVDEVNIAIPTIIFEAKDGAGNDLGAVKVSMDDEVLAERLEGTALSVDPGEHTFVFETAGGLALTKTFIISVSQKDRRETITFGPPVSSDGAGVPSTEDRSGLASGGAETPSTEGGSGLGTQKILALVAEGIGVVGLGMGSAFGLVALSRKSDAEKVCPNLCVDASGVNKWNDAKSAADVSTVAFLAGGLALAGGAVLWFTARTASPVGAPTAAVGIGLASLQVKGAW
jgi:hypothetical protein